MRYFQHVLNPGRIESVRHPIDLEVYAADPIWEEVPVTPSDPFASMKPSDAERPYCPVHGDLLAGVRSERCRTAGEGHEMDADVTERLADAWDDGFEMCYRYERGMEADPRNPYRSHATPPFTTEQEIESLASEIHEAYAYQYDECDHGTYAGGAMHGEPYSMCRINAERIIRRRSNPPVAATGEVSR